MRKLSLVLSLLAIPFAFGCTGGGGATDAGTTDRRTDRPTGDTPGSDLPGEDRPDPRDVRPPVDGGASVPEGCPTCPSGEACTVTGAGCALGCAPEGPGAAFASCGEEGCVAGHLCAGASETEMSCLPFCRENSDCASEQCLSIRGCPATVKVCAPGSGPPPPVDGGTACEPMNPSSCPSGEGCTVVGAGCRLGCAPAGPAAAGAPCGEEGCVVGHLCAGASETSMTCLRFCASNADCSGGNCVGIRGCAANVKVCAPGK
jgi:hypothetical protein